MTGPRVDRRHDKPKRVTKKKRARKIGQVREAEDKAFDRPGLEGQK
jgi:hypothetical protein